jgi:hypothetical protein
VLLSATPPAHAAMDIGVKEVVEERKTLNFIETFERFQTSHNKNK